MEQSVGCFELTNESLLSYQAYAVANIWSRLVIQAVTVWMINSSYYSGHVITCQPEMPYSEGHKHVTDVKLDSTVVLPRTQGCCSLRDY